MLGDLDVHRLSAQQGQTHVLMLIIPFHTTAAEAAAAQQRLTCQCAGLQPGLKT